MRLRRAGTIGRDQAGSTTVEFVVWLPFFFLLFGVLVDSALLMQRQTQMFDVARAASRLVAVGRADAAQAEAYVRGQLPESAVEGGVADVTISSDMVVTSISIPFAEVILFGDVLLGDAALTASVTMVREALPDEEVS